MTIQHKGAELIWRCLEQEGVDLVFGYPGGAILPAYDALVDARIRHVLVRHEQAAAHMADGYARATGRTGVVIATSGPGATNLVTGLATAMLDSTPLVAITGQVSSALLGTDGFQEVDVTGVTLPITKHNYLVRRAEDIAPAIREAFAVARHGRPGPVLVDITKDAQQGSAPLRWEGAQATRHLRQGHVPIPAEALAEAAAMIAESRRPIILAGQGVLQAEATRELLELAEGQELPVALTLLGLGALPASHPLNLGMLGMHGEVWVNQAIQESDLVLALGMRFDDRATGRLEAFAPHARKIHIDIDPAELQKNVRVDLAVVADLKEALYGLIPRLAPVRRPDWLARVASLRGKQAVRDLLELPDDGHLYAAHVMHDLWRTAGSDAVVVTDVGQHQMWEAQYFRHERPRSLLTSGGLGTMGFSLPAAIGAKLARPEASVWSISGDGGFQMNMQELAVLVQEGLKVQVVIINNGYLGMVRQWQEFFYERRYSATPLLSPDFCKVAEAYGLRALRVERRQDVIPALQEAEAHPASILLEFRVEQEDSVYPMVPAGAALHDMILRPSPLVETGADAH